MALGKQHRDENAFRKLAAEAYGAPAEQRNALIGQAVGIDPQAGLALNTTLQQQDDNITSKAAGAARYVLNAVETKNPQAVQGAYQAVRPFLARIGAAQGKVPPDQWSDDMLPMLHQVVAASGGATATGQGVQSTYVDGDGNRVAILRDGTTRILGQNDAGMVGQTISVQGPDGRPMQMTFNKRTMQYEPAVLGGGAPAAPATGPSRQALMGADGTPVVIDADVPPEIAAQIRAGEKGGGVPAMIEAPSLAAAPLGMPLVGQSPAEKAAAEAAAKAQVEAAYAPQIAGATERAKADAQAEAAARYGTDESRKAAAEAATKIPQLQNVVRGLDRIQSALSGISGALVDTGPVDQYITRRLPEGQELEAAVNGIKNSLLALTRVPGVGSQSDLEQRIADMQYPSLDKDPAVNARTMANLRAFVQDIQRSIAERASGAQTTRAVVPQQPASGAVRRARNPRTGEILELRNGQWVPAR